MIEWKRCNSSSKRNKVQFAMVAPHELKFLSVKQALNPTFLKPSKYCKFYMPESLQWSYESSEFKAISETVTIRTQMSCTATTWRKNHDRDIFLKSDAAMLCPGSNLELWILNWTKTFPSFPQPGVYTKELRWPVDTQVSLDNCRRTCLPP